MSQQELEPNVERQNEIRRSLRKPYINSYLGEAMAYAVGAYLIVTGLSSSDEMHPQITLITLGILSATGGIAVHLSRRGYPK